MTIQPCAICGMDFLAEAEWDFTCRICDTEYQEWLDEMIEKEFEEIAERYAKRELID